MGSVEELGPRELHRRGRSHPGVAAFDFDGTLSSRDNFTPWRPVDVPVRLDRETLALALADGSRTPVRAVVVLGYEPNLVGEMSMGHRVLMTSGAVARRGRLAADDVRVLARLMATTPFVWVVGYDPSDVVRAIGRLDRELPGAPAVSPVPSS